MNYISVDILEKYNCCKDQVNLFEKLFPTGIVEFNSLREAELLAKKYSSKFDFGHLGKKVFGDTYQEAIEPHLDTYQEAEKPHDDAYQEAIGPHYEAYKEAEKPLLDTYYDEKEPLWDAYEEATKPYYDAYLEAIKPHLDACKLAQSQVFAKLWYELKEE